VTAGRDHDAAALDAAALAGLAGETPGCPVALERAATRVGSVRRHLVPCYLVRRER
jgi:hypothetical protein